MPLAKLEAFDPQTVQLSAFAKALSHPARIQVLQYLADKQEVPCMQIVESLPLSQAACSRHLGELLKVGLITARTAGSHVYYRSDRTALSNFCQSMTSTLHS